MAHFLVDAVVSTPLSKEGDTVVTLSLSKGLVLQSRQEASARAEILRLRFAPLRMTCFIFYLTL